MWPVTFKLHFYVILFLSAFTRCLITLNELENIKMSGAKSDLMDQCNR